MIDLNSNKTFTPSELKARSISRLQESIGYEELITALARAVFALRNEYTLTPEADAKLSGVAALIAGEELEWIKETADNTSLTLAIEHEQANARLAQPVLDPKAVDADGNLMYPKVDDGKGKMVMNPALVTDGSERKAAQVVITGATKATLALVKKRAATLAAQATVA